MSFLDHLNESVINIEDLFETVKRLQDDAQALKDSKQDLEELLERERKQNQSQSIFKT